IGVPVGQLFIGAAIPGLMLVIAYIAYIAFIAWKNPELAPAITIAPENEGQLVSKVFRSLLPPLALIIAVLGSIFFGIASPTESAAVGALGAILLALLHKKLSVDNLNKAMQQTTRLTSMVFLILIGATAFGLVFVGMGGDDLIFDIFSDLPGGKWGFLILSMVLIFVLGFFLDFIEICFIVVPIIAPIAIHLGLDPLWFALLIALNLQTSFLTPPFGFALFYLKGVSNIDSKKLYKGVIPFIIIQLIVLMLLAWQPWLTSLIRF
ncbi:MAG: TRAP transporter large permease subunit, partial [Alcanivoracaceae bacterium]|nr:TRAP transporter large permease subunit [Alcanivoracaceae bacterium]